MKAAIRCDGLVAQPSPASAATSRSSSRSMRCQLVTQACYEDPISQCADKLKPDLQVRIAGGGHLLEKAASNQASRSGRQLAAHQSDPQQTAKTSCCVVRLRAVVVGEDR